MPGPCRACELLPSRDPVRDLYSAEWRRLDFQLNRYAVKPMALSQVLRVEKWEAVKLDMISDVAGSAGDVAEQLQHDRPPAGLILEACSQEVRMKMASSAST